MNIIELELLSDDLPETERFYKKVLGLEPYLKDGKSVLFFNVGSTRLIFRKSDNIHPVYHFAIDIASNRFFDCHNFIKQLTAIIPADGDDIVNFPNWDAKSFYFYDNNGNIVEIITRYANKTYHNNSYSNRAFIAVSEIGMVTDSVPQLADTLKNEFGIAIFKRQPRSDKFAVCGDDSGLFIIALKNRDWYPTTVKAKSFTTRVLYMDNGNVGYIVR